MQQWAASLRSIGEVHDELVYPKPFNLMGKLCDAHIAALEKAAK